MEWFLDTSNFTPRSHCGNWNTWLMVLSQVGDGLYVASYYAIPVFLLILWRRKHKVLPAGYIVVWFAAFIFFCGTTHLMNILSFEWPAYRFFILCISVPGGIISVITAVMLPQVVRYAMTLRTPEEYRMLLKEKEDQLTLKEQAEHKVMELNSRLELHNRDLEKQVAQLRRLVEHMQNEQGFDKQARQMMNILRDIRDA